MKKLLLTAMLSATLGATGMASAAQEPRYGGVLNFVAPYGDSFSTLDIQMSALTQDQIYAQAIYRALYDWDGNENKPVLGLATEVSVSPDKLTYTYKLRQNAYFHNGKPLTADDIIWSYTRIMDPTRAFPGVRHIREIQGATEYAEGKAKTISGLKKIDDHTLAITLTQATDPAFLFMWHNTSIYPAGEGDSEAFQRHPIGLGPYKLVEYIPGSRFTVEKFDRYYETGKPYIDKINIMIMGDASARDVAFRNREIDVSVLGSAQYVVYGRDPDLSKNILEVAESYTRMVGFNPDFKPFADKRVRQAINYAINRELIIERLVKNKAYLATSWLPPASPAFDKNAKPYPYDPDKARALLKEAGYPDGFEFELSATQNESWGVPIVEAIIPMLDRVGIKVKAKPVESSVMASVATTGDFQAYMWSLASGPDALMTMRCFHSSVPQGACNYQKFANPEYDRLLDTAAATEDEAQKNELLRQANNLLQEEAPVWFFNYNKAVIAHQPWLHGLQPNASEISVQSYEKLWLDETAPARR